jgi:hypothetical protein
MPKDNFEVYTSADKDRRDRLFEELRAHGNAEERQAVKFSGVEAHPAIPGAYRSTWSVAHPREGEKPKVIRKETVNVEGNEKISAGE